MNGAALPPSAPDPGNCHFVTTAPCLSFSSASLQEYANDMTALNTSDNFNIRLKEFQGLTEIGCWDSLKIMLIFLNYQHRWRVREYFDLHQCMKRSNGTENAAVSYANDYCMTKLLYVCLAFTLMAFQCNKNDAGADSGLIAKWKMTEYWYSPAGPLVYAPAPSDNILIEFGYSGFFFSNTATFPGYEQYTKYIVTNDKTLQLLKPDLSEKVTLNYRLDKDTLILDGRCIEGCGQKFVRVK